MGEGSKCKQDCERANYLIADPRSQGICFYCRKEIDFNVPDGPLLVEHDHFISKANGGKDHRSNMVASCVPCNRRKGKLNGDQFLKIIREEINTHEPRHYSMPESFMYDQKVPARWRLLGVINGFHIGGLPFYASNEWLKAKLNCSEQTIVNAMKELEESGEIRCERTSTSRKVYRGYDSSQLGSRPKPALVSDPSQLETNSVSNSVKDISVATAPQIVEVKEDSEERPKTKPKYPNAPTVFSWFPKPEPSWKLNTTQLKHAELLWLRGEDKVRAALKYVSAHKDDENFYQVLTPQDLESKWVKIAAYAKRNN